MKKRAKGLKDEALKGGPNVLKDNFGVLSGRQKALLYAVFAVFFIYFVCLVDFVAEAVKVVATIGTSVCLTRPSVWYDVTSGCGKRPVS